MPHGAARLSAYRLFQRLQNDLRSVAHPFFGTIAVRWSDDIELLTPTDTHERLQCAQGNALIVYVVIQKAHAPECYIFPRADDFLGRGPCAFQKTSNELVRHPCRTCEPPHIE